MSSKQQSPELFLKNFKERIEAIKELRIKVGIPKEFKKHDFSEVKSVKQRSREDRERMARSLFDADFLRKKSLQEHSAEFLAQMGIKKEEEEIYIANIAFKNNFGSFKNKIPARPFGSTLIPRYKDKIEKIFKRELYAFLRGEQDLLTAYNRIGITTEGYMKDNLKNGDWKPNSPITVFLKGSSQPLINTGQMRLAITYVVTEAKDE